MKKHEIKVGGLYRAKVAGKLTTVRVEGIEDRPYGAGKAHTAYHVWNLSTGRKTTFRSAAKFRCEVTEQEHRYVTEKNDRFLERYGHAATHATIEEQRSDADVGPTSSSGDRGRVAPRPCAGPAAAAPAGPVVAAEVAGDSEPKQLDWCGNLQCRGF